MLRQFLFLALLCGVSGTAISAQLTLVSSVDVIALNGKAMDEQRVVDLPLGTNQIVIRYVKVLRDGTNKKKFESVPYVFRLNVDNNSDNYSINLPRFREYSVAQAAFDNHKVDWKIEKNGQRIANPEMTILPGNKGLLPYSDIELAVKNYNSRNGVTLVPVELSSSSVAGPAVNPMKDMGAQEAGAPKKSVSKFQSKEVKKMELRTSDAFVTQIKNWYLDASSDQRKALMKWMIEQQ